ncbi:MAG: hypothetical protein JRC60_05670 [Deltaproteobacteria bacterium]|nr:hypothetical protein [Deltaproteobacteria bacterium]
MEVVPPLTYSVAILQILGLPGLIFIIWYFDNKRFQRQEESRKAEMQITLDQYRQDVSEIKRLYESNSRLVEDCTKAFCRLDGIYTQVIDVVSLNTQTQTELVESIKGNQFCPIVRQKGASQL